MPPASEFLQVLVCPRCKGGLKVRGSTLDCQQCRVRYPVEQGVPVLLTRRAKAMTEEPGDGANAP